jgi:hypothetical protein
MLSQRSINQNACANGDSTDIIDSQGNISNGGIGGT